MFLFIQLDGCQVCTTSEKIDLSESAVNIFLSGEVGPVVVDQVALLSCPGVVFISIAFVVFVIVIVVNISSDMRSTLKETDGNCAELPQRSARPCRETHWLLPCIRWRLWCY